MTTPTVSCFVSFASSVSGAPSTATAPAFKAKRLVILFINSSLVEPQGFAGMQSGHAVGYAGPAHESAEFRGDRSQKHSGKIARLKPPNRQSYLVISLKPSSKTNIQLSIVFFA